MNANTKFLIFSLIVLLVIGCTSKQQIIVSNNTSSYQENNASHILTVDEVLNDSNSFVGKEVEVVGLLFVPQERQVCAGSCPPQNIHGKHERKFIPVWGNLSSNDSGKIVRVDGIVTKKPEDISQKLESSIELPNIYINLINYTTLTSVSSIYLRKLNVGTLLNCDFISTGGGMSWDIIESKAYFIVTLKPSGAGDGQYIELWFEREGNYSKFINRLGNHSPCITVR